MRCVTTPADELAIFTLSRLYRRHSVVYTKDKTWSTIGTSTPMSEKEVYQQCDLKFILMGKGHYVQLIKKPSLTMPVLPLQPMESVYESSYYKNTTPVENIKDTTNGFTSLHAEPSPQRDEEVATTTGSKQYCAVHGCKVPDTKNIVQCDNDNPTPSEQEMINFPIAAKICKTTNTSSLQDFNPLNDSEPNLEFDVTDHDNAGNPDLHVKLMQDARTRKWQVKIRNLTQEQVDFIARPRLLPTLTKTDAVVIEHHDTTLSEKHNEHEQPPVFASDSLAEPNSAKSNNSSSAASGQNGNSTNSNINEIPPNKSDIPTNGPK